MFQNSYFLATIAILFWASAPSAFKLSLEYLAPYELLLGSSFVTAIVLGSIVLFKNGFKYFLKIDKKVALLMLCMGVINPALYYLASLKSYQILPAQQAQPITYSWVLMLVFMSAFLYKERLTKMDILASFICYGGVFVVASRGGDVGNINFFGVALALLAAFLWAFYWLVCARIKTDPLVVLFLNFFGGFIFLVALLPFFYESKAYAWQGVAGVVYVGLFEMSLGFLCWLGALKYAKNISQIANLAFIIPFVSLIFVNFLLKEQIESSTVIGLVLIVGGLVLQKFMRQQQKI